jgi:hypothetical protein
MQPQVRAFVKSPVARNRLPSQVRLHFTPRPRTSEVSQVDSTLARPGGDEFTVLAENLHDPSDAVRVVKRATQNSTRPCMPAPSDGFRNMVER